MARSDRLIRLVVPMAVIAAAAMIARAYDTTWIAPKSPLLAKPLKDDLDEIQRRLEAREGTAACPWGYVDMQLPGISACKGDGLPHDGITHPAADEIVKVGHGLSAFWIDRYEASVWDKADGTGKQWGIAADDYPMASFPKNGQRGPANPNFVALYALSKAGVPPSASITWFQALEACAASGKRLPTDDEWLRAASGTKDDGAVDGLAMNEKRCNTQAAGKRNTGGGTNCASAWGAQDMIGNMWEWTANWYTGAGNGMGHVNQGAQNWPGGAMANALYNQDGTWNVQAWTEIGGGQASGVPAAGIRGADWNFGTRAGVFSLFLNDAPSSWSKTFGFRCAAR